jgi:16S rRNA (uracil1498-N3)-methyltransferase
MRHHRIYTEHPLNAGLTFELDDAPARHLLQVLRLKAGSQVILFNGDGHDYPARLEQTSRRSARVTVMEKSPVETEANLSIHLAIGISKGERMDFALQKAVELGVRRITPLLTERSVVRLSAERQEKRLLHWRGIIIAACEQSGRARIPECRKIQTLPGWLDSTHGERGILLDHRADAGLSQLQPPTAQINLLVGPEGGLSPDERRLAAEHQLEAVRLGPRVLRTETAPLAAISAIQVLWGDFN